MSQRATTLLIVTLLIVTSTALAQAQSSEPPETTVHTVQRGQTLLSIAQEYGTTVDAITHANGIADPRRIYVGQRLVIPERGEGSDTMELVPYVVQAGDTVSSIARHYGITWQTLVHVNSLLSPNAIYPGLVIKVPRVASSGEKPGAFPQTVGSMIYLVHPNDTLRRIALRHNVSPWTLVVNNHMTDLAAIYPGRELVVPGEGPGLLPAPFASIEIQPLPVTQGTTMIIAVHTTEPVKLQGELFDQDVHFAEESGAYYGVAGVHVFTEPGLYKLTLTAWDSDGHSTALTTEVVVRAGHFGYERIDLPADRASLLDPAIIATERERLDSVQYTFTPERHWTTPFQRPCVGTITAYYGTHRAYAAGPYTSYHTGVDFRAPTGTPVHAAAAGTVVLAEPLTVRGNVVFIDHGWGVLTGYWHLSSIEVEVGQYVEQGEVVARVGNTGLSTGAHLHWEFWVGGVSVDGLQWLDESLPWPMAGDLATGG
ncbi:MAG: LysM peptidoglycan-binding domain-containing protein [Anaerolineae bacterium]|nr:LysM peptidoglycan-binding domain-containing protein [Anaerolineae bacterium]